MTRQEFGLPTKRQALERSGGQCEAMGERYGMPHGVRCQRRVFKGHVNYEHWPRGAHDPHPDTRSLGNCTAICPECNKYANNKFDTPREAKMKRVQARRGRTALQIDRPPKREPKMRGRSTFPTGRKLRSRNTFQPRRDR